MQLKSGKKNNIILVCIVFFLKTDAFTIPTVKNSVFLQEQLKAMVDAVDGILTEYVSMIKSNNIIHTKTLSLLLTF